MRAAPKRRARRRDVGPRRARRPASPPTTSVYLGRAGRREGAASEAGEQGRAAGTPSTADAAARRPSGARRREAGKDAASDARPRSRAKAKLEAAAQGARMPPSADLHAADADLPRRRAAAGVRRWRSGSPSRDNPLTARVAVNHIWAWHFGRPLVETTSNFGRSGKPPTHPELLDWLAVELMDPIRSGAGRHEAPAPADRDQPRLPHVVAERRRRPNAKADPDNVYLWQFPTDRLEAEVVRDSLLASPANSTSRPAARTSPQDQGLTSRRRSLYFAHHGEARMEFLDLFDAANPCDAYRRTTSVLPQQALALTNSELALRLSRVLAGKLSATAKDDDAFVRAAFEQVLGRPPREAEAAASRDVPGAAARAVRRERRRAEGRPEATGGPSADPAQRARENLVLRAVQPQRLRDGPLTRPESCGLVRIDRHGRPADDPPPHLPRRRRPGLHRPRPRGDAPPRRRRAARRRLVARPTASRTSPRRPRASSGSSSPAASATWRPSTPSRRSTSTPARPSPRRRSPTRSSRRCSSSTRATSSATTRPYPKIFPLQVGFKKHGKSASRSADWLPAPRRRASTTSPSSGRCTRPTTTTAPSSRCTPAGTSSTSSSRSIGSWVNYGLGTLNENLPQFVFLGQYKDARVKKDFAADYLGPQHAGVELSLDPKNPLPFGTRGQGVLAEGAGAAVRLRPTS